MEKIVKDVMLLKSMLIDLDVRIHKLSKSDIQICEAILESEEANTMLHPDFVKRLTESVTVTKSKFIKQAETAISSLKKI